MVSENEKGIDYQELVNQRCGTYNPGDLTSKQQAEAIRLLQARLVRYKVQENAEEEIGPLQPAWILSQISKVPIEVVEAIAESFGLELPEEVQVQDDEIEFDPEDMDEVPEEFFSESNTMPSEDVDFVEATLDGLRSGAIDSISVIVIGKNGDVSLWVPRAVDGNQVEELFSPLISAMTTGKGPSN